MDTHEAYEVLLRYQLLNKDNSGLASIYEIEERYEKFRASALLSSSPLARRVNNVLEACAAIQDSLVSDVERLQFRAQMEDDEFDSEYKKYLDEMDREIIAEVGKPLPSSPLDINPHLLQIYEKYKARTLSEKISALEKESGDKPGQVHVHTRGDWREPKWKRRQIKLRALAFCYLVENRLIDVEFC